MFRSLLEEKLAIEPKYVLEIPAISNGAWEKYPHETNMQNGLRQRVMNML
jgi:hypothetical protein